MNNYPNWTCHEYVVVEGHPSEGLSGGGQGPGLGPEGRLAPAVLDHELGGGEGPAQVELQLGVSSRHQVHLTWCSHDMFARWSIVLGLEISWESYGLIFM